MPSITRSPISMVSVYSQSSHSLMLQELQKQAFNLFQICRAELPELLIELNCRVPCTMFTWCVCDRSTFVTSQNILCTRCFLFAYSPMTDAHHFTIDAVSRRRAPVNFISSLRRQFLCMHQHHHALLFHDQFQSSSIHVAPCLLCAMNTTIQIHVHSWTIQHNHLTKWNDGKMVYP